MYLCWSAKGGSGTTVIAAALALVLSQRGATTVVDLAGDLPAAWASPNPPGQVFAVSVGIADRRCACTRTVACSS